MNWYLEVLRKYAEFSGRARRKEYWMFTLFNLLITVVLALIDGAIGSFSSEGGIGILGAIYGLAVLLPGIAVMVRRLHDTDHSGWWWLILLIPLIGAIVFLLFLVREGTPGSNRYGSNPKEASA